MSNGYIKVDNFAIAVVNIDWLQLKENKIKIQIGESLFTVTCESPEHAKEQFEEWTGPISNVSVPHSTNIH